MGFPNKTDSSLNAQAGEGWGHTVAGCLEPTADTAVCRARVVLGLGAGGDAQLSPGFLTDTPPPGHGRTPAAWHTSPTYRGSPYLSAS